MKLYTKFSLAFLTAFLAGTAFSKENQADKPAKYIMACLKDDKGIFNDFMNEFKIKGNKINYLLLESTNEGTGDLDGYNMTREAHVYLYDKSIIKINAFINYEFKKDAIIYKNLVAIYSDFSSSYPFYIHYTQNKEAHERMKPVDVTYDTNNYSGTKIASNYFPQPIDKECLDHFPKKFIKNFKME